VVHRNVNGVLCRALEREWGAFGCVACGRSLGQAGPSFVALAQGQAAAYKIFQVLERKPEIDSGDLSGEVLEDVRGTVEMQKVVFSYPSRPDVRIFNDFSLAIPAGKSVALVGRAGAASQLSSRSSSASPRRPRRGRCSSTGGTFVRCSSSGCGSSWRWCRRSPVLFHTTVRGNISYGRSTPLSEDELVQGLPARQHPRLHPEPAGGTHRTWPLGLPWPCAQTTLTLPLALSVAHITRHCRTNYSCPVAHIQYSVLVAHINPGPASESCWRRSGQVTRCWGVFDEGQLSVVCAALGGTAGLRHRGGGSVARS